MTSREYWNAIRTGCSRIARARQGSRAGSRVLAWCFRPDTTVAPCRAVTSCISDARPISKTPLQITNKLLPAIATLDNTIHYDALNATDVYRHRDLGTGQITDSRQDTVSHRPVRDPTYASLSAGCYALLNGNELFTLFCFPLLVSFSMFPLLAKLAHSLAWSSALPCDFPFREMVAFRALISSTGPPSIYTRPPLSLHFPSFFSHGAFREAPSSGLE